MYRQLLMFSVIWVKCTGDVVIFLTKRCDIAVRVIENNAEFFIHNAKITVNIFFNTNAQPTSSYTGSPYLQWIWTGDAESVSLVWLFPVGKNLENYDTDTFNEFETIDLN